MPLSTSFSLGAGLGPLSNREPQYQNQNTLLIDKDGRIRYAAISRRVLALPPEILAEIFLHCLPDVEFVKPDITFAPILLCGICRPFREIALLTPGLWSSLRFDAELATERDLIRSWLFRARKAPLSLRFHYGAGEGWDSDSARSILQTIVELAPQWRNISLNITPGLAKLLPTAGNFPLLEKLDFAAFGGFHAEVSFRDAPKLRQVNALTYHRVRHTTTQLPWHQITTLRAASISFDNCLAILRDATNLVDGTFEVGNERPDSLTEPVPDTLQLRMTHLQSLTLVGMRALASPIAPMHVLKYLTAPALKSLTLQFTPSDHDPAVDLNTSPFLSFIFRSSCQLHTLVLSLVATPDAIIRCLNLLPSLVVLKILPLRVADIHTVFLQLTGHPDFLPKLESLHVNFTDRGCVLHSEALPASAVIDLLRWRWATPGVARLRSLQLAHEHTTSVIDEIVNASEFKRLAAEGMDLYVGPFRPGIDWVYKHRKHRKYTTRA
ncbi:hypothetical protein B0H17DRAFT_1034873 [Mycena rosella]|uniref:F-box domain-containing protein n=1 Tax=Mycena rosella TaxID=1033263 RepID=A0AAD7M9I2_MYCRO|nr:hypothetical protein B0H17DRAFT_1034873 [Mycena rosella]